MACETTGGSEVIRNRNFKIFLFGQGVSNFGDAFHFIAVTTLLVKMTGSGLSAAFGLISYPILSILLSPLAGYICDVKNEKALLVILDLARMGAAFLFIARRETTKIYALIILLSILDILYNPPRRKFLTGILENGRILAGNSLLNGLSGGVSVIGPVLAGFIVSNFGPDIAFAVKSVTCLISALAIIKVRYRVHKEPGAGRRITGKPAALRVKPGRHAVASMLEGVKYCFNTFALRRIILISSAVSFMATSINFAFYPFVFDVLKISDKVWGSMMSIFYGASLVATPISLLLKFRTETYYKAVIPLSLVIISVIWFSYGNSSGVGIIMLLQLIEGTVLSYLGIILTSHLQMESKNSILGRVAGTSDLVSNIGRIVSIGCTYILLRISTPNTVFFLCALALFAYAFFTLASVGDNRLKATKSGCP